VEHDTARATEIIAAFDLDRLYGADENPAAGALRAR
jgi:hypothetical protein